MIFSSLQSSALEAAEKLINSALQYDPATQRRIAELEGKLLLVESTVPPFSLAIEATGSGIMLHSNWQDSADTKVSGPLLAMLELAASNEEQFSFAGTGISVNGDLEFLININNLMQKLDVDWEDALASIIGDIPAHLLADRLRSGAVMAKQAATRARTAAVEITQEELRASPTLREFEQFSQEVRQLSNEAERAAAKLNKTRQIIEQLVTEKLASDPGEPEAKS